MSDPKDERTAAAIKRATDHDVPILIAGLGVPQSTLRYWIQQDGLAHLIPRD